MTDRPLVPTTNPATALAGRARGVVLAQPTRTRLTLTALVNYHTNDTWHRIWNMASAMPTNFHEIEITALRIRYPSESNGVCP